MQKLLRPFYSLPYITAVKARLPEKATKLAVTVLIFNLKDAVQLIEEDMQVWEMTKIA